MSSDPPTSATVRKKNPVRAMNYELFYYALTALTTAATAYGSVKARLTAVEKSLQETNLCIRKLSHELSLLRLRPAQAP